MAGYETESNDSGATANQLSSGSSMSGQLSSSSDLDWYKLTVAAPGVITVALDVPTNSTFSDYFGLSFYNTSGALQNSYTTGVDGTYRFSASAAGTYYLLMNAPGYSYSGGSYSLTATHAAGSVAGYETESNDSGATANQLSSGSSMSGQLSSSSDLDWYKLTVAAPGVITVALDVPTNSTFSDYFGLSFYNTSGALLGRYGTGIDRTFQFSASQVGTYYFRVDAPGYYFNNGSYSLTATSGASSNDQELEPNDDDANVIASGRQVRGQLSTIDDIDWFVLASEGTGDLQIAFDAPTDSTSTDYFRVWVYDEDANLLASRATGRDISFTVGARTKGNYFVAITSAGNVYYNLGQYGLTVTAIASSVNRESEPNDTSTSADDVSLNEPILGQLAASDDEDYYAVTMSSPGVLTLSFDGPTNSNFTNYFTVSVFSPTGTLLGTRSTGSDTSLDVKATTAGRYTAVISAASSWAFSGEDYRLTATAVLEDPIPSGAITGTSLGERLIGTAQDDLIYGLGGDDMIDGGAGSDTVVFRSSATSLSINTIGGLTAVRGGFNAGEHAFTVSRVWNTEKIKTSTDEKQLPTTSVSPLLGTKVADRITGTIANDVVDGLGGSDFVDGGGGSDTLILFGPRDKFDVQSITGITRVEGLDSTQEYAGSVMRLVNVENLAFTQSQTRSLSVDTTPKVFGSVGSERLVGTASDEVFDGLGGADTIDGGAGSDTLVLFGRYEDFSISLPTTQKSVLTITGKSTGPRDYAGHILNATNIEKVIFSGDDLIEVTNPPALIVVPTSTLVAEGETGKVLSVSLSAQPTRVVQVSIETGSQLASTTASLSFDQVNWNQPQNITVSAVDDKVLERQHTATLMLKTTSDDARYKSLASTVPYTITDNDTQNLGGVTGRLWNDQDRDGFIDVGEQSLIGWTVFDDINRNGRLDAEESSASTDSSGLYRLDELAPGRHTIVARSQTGWSATFPSLQTGSAVVLKNTAGSEEASIGGGYANDIFDETAATGNYTNLGVATNIAAFRNDPRFSDIEGQGLAAVVIDTGIDLDHPFFGADANRDGIADRIVYQYDFYGSNDGNASDGGGHGTHVAGIVSSSDSTYPGIAPKINLIALKVFPEGKGSASSIDITEAVNWVVANASRYNIVAVNLSFGSNDFDTTARSSYLSTQFRALANAGVIVVSASGNGYDEYPRQGVAYPSSDPYSLSVGAVWASSGGNWGAKQTNAPMDAIAVFSQRDDTESDVFAPGAYITSAKSGGGAVAMPGTSMAAPEITGMVALAQQLAIRELGRRLSFEEIRDLFKSTGKPIIDGDDENDVVTNTGLTFYRADMLKLGEAIVGMRPQVSHSVDIVAGKTLEAKNFGFSATSAVQTTSAEDYIVGASTGEVIRGGSGDDTIRGEAGDDKMYGEAGNDVLEGGSGDDFLDGGAGIDSVVFSVARSNASVTFDSASNQYTVSSIADGIDVVTGVENYVFGSQNISVQNLLNSQGDVIPPAIQSFSPSTGATNVAVDSNIVVRFSESIQKGTGNIEIRDGSMTGTVVESFAVASSSRLLFSGSTLTIDPIANLGNGSTYFVVFTANSIQDLSENGYSGMENYFFSTTATSTSKTIVGTPGNDSFIWDFSKGAAQIIGGYGLDQLIVSGKSSEYLTSPSSISKGGVTASLSEIERVRFQDNSVALDLTGNAGKAYRVYKAAFARDPQSGDMSGLGFWISRIDNGMDMVEVAARFIDSPEFRGLYGQNPSNADFLTKVYTNVLGRTPDQGGYNWWLNELNTNPSKTKSKLLADFAESSENQTGVASLIGNGIQYTEFVG
jgi:Ca2+-binding RTX toxin-like protein